MLQLSGTIKQIDDLKTFDSGFTKREFVLTTEDGKYSQDIKFETVRDKTSLLDNYKVGDQVTASFDVRGNEYNGRHYVNLNCWKIQEGNGNSQQPAKKGNKPFDNPFPSGDGEPSSEELGSTNDDDIPF